MFSVLARSAARTLGTATGIHIECAAAEDSEVLYVTVDLHSMRSLSLSPLPDRAWAHVAGACARTVSPVCRAICSTLHGDIEHVARLLAELEPPVPAGPACSFVMPEQHAAKPVSHPEREGERPPRKRRRSSVRPAEIVIRSTQPDVPTIVITPCPSQPRASACRVPYQDAAFGNRLAVPMHPRLNAAFPPLLAALAPPVEDWQYERGHWRAVLPDVEEQMARGMFSRPLSLRRRKARPPVCDATPSGPCEGPSYPNIRRGASANVY